MRRSDDVEYGCICRVHGDRPLSLLLARARCSQVTCTLFKAVLEDEANGLL